MSIKQIIPNPESAGIKQAIPNSGFLNAVSWETLVCEELQ